MRKAIQAKDWEKAAGCMDANSQDLLARGLAFAISFLAETDDKKKKAAEAMFKKHGFDTDDGCSSEVADKPAFIAKLFAFAEAHTPDDDFTSLAKLLAGRLTDVKIDGDEAAGIIEIEGEDSQPIEYRRIDGHWFVHLPEKRFSM